MAEEYVDASKRLDCLSRVCLALGTALDGLGRMKRPPADEVTELARQLIYATKQATWMARTSDPGHAIQEYVGSPRDGVATQQPGTDSQATN